MARLHATVQREGETVITVTNRFEEIARRAYSDMRGDHIKTLTLIQYQNSHLPHIGKHVLLKQPTSITEAQKLATLIDQNPTLFPNDSEEQWSAAGAGE